MLRASAYSIKEAILNRFSRSNPCPICRGYDALRRGTGERCFGFISEDKQYAHCSREEHAGKLDFNTNSATYAHRLSGTCNCGVSHDGSSSSVANRKATILATYSYRDADGRELYQNVRYFPKDFRTRRPDGVGGWIWNLQGINRELYRLPELLGSPVEDPVFVAEGEKDADNLAHLGFTATTNLGGAGKWRTEHNQHLRGRKVILLPDNDQPGRDHMHGVARSLGGIAASIKIVDLPGVPPKGDVSDWIAAGGTKEQLSQLVDQAAQWGKIDSPQGDDKGALVWEEKKLFYTPKELSVGHSGSATTWVSYPWLAVGNITEFTGKVKAAGKTTFLTRIIAAVLGGEEFIGQPTLRTEVVYLTEQHWSSFSEAVQRAGLLEANGLHIMFWGKMIGTPWPEVVRLGVKKCKQVGATLLIIDTLPQWAALEGDAENNAGAAMEAMRPLQEAKAQDIAIAVVRHDRKSAGDVGDSARGSSAWSGSMDILVSIRTPEGNTNPRARVIKCRSRLDGPPDELLVELTPDGYVSHGVIQPLATKKAVDALRQVLPLSGVEALTTTQIIETTGLASSTLDRAIKQLGGDVVRLGEGKRGDPFRYHLVGDNNSHQTQSGTSTTDGNQLGTLSPVVMWQSLSGLLPLPVTNGLTPSSCDPGEPPACRVHGTNTSWWMRPTGGWVCGGCHENPHGDGVLVVPASAVGS